jgi:hypothetical protein
MSRAVPPFTWRPTIEFVRGKPRWTSIWALYDRSGKQVCFGNFAITERDEPPDWPLPDWAAEADYSAEFDRLDAEEARVGRAELIRRELEADRLRRGEGDL